MREIAVREDGGVGRKEVEAVYEAGIFFVHYEESAWEKVPATSPDASFPNDNVWAYRRGEEIVWRSRRRWFSRRGRNSPTRHDTLEEATGGGVRGEYVVTHAPSGMATERVPTKAQALKLCRAWHRIGGPIGDGLSWGETPDGELRERLHRARAEVAAACR